MTLRNAFGEMALDATVQSLVETLEGLHEYLLMKDRAGSRELSYARDSADVLRANITGGTITASQFFGTTSNAVPGWYTTGAPNSMDAREVQRDMSTQTFQQRRARWEFS